MMIWQFLTASVLLTLMPGPDILFVLAQSLQRGFRAAVSVGLGLCSGLVFHTAAVVAGVAVVLENSPALFTGIKYCGAAYLIWLGVKNILDARRKNTSAGDLSAEEAADAAPQKSYWGLYRQGITMNLLNPKVALFFLSFLPGFVPKQSGTPAADIVLLGALFAAQAIVVFTGVAFAGGWLSKRLRIEKYVGSPGFAIVAALLYLGIAVLIVL